MLFSTKWLGTIFKVSQGNISADIQVKTVTTDSRLKTKNSLFIPLIGERFDGHDYVNEAFNNGCVAIIWDENKKLPDFIPIDFPVFFVNNTLEALQYLAKMYRDEVNPTVIGITGSNGKTTTKDIVASVLKTTYHTHYTQGNLNNHIGLPLTILEMDRKTEMLILEMGMSNFKEIDQLTKIAQPDYAIITNIGESHIEFLGSREGIAKAKLEIINGLTENGTLILDGDEHLLSAANSNHIITCGYQTTNHLIIKDVEVLHDKTVFSIMDGHRYTIPLLGKHQAQNASYAIALGKKLNIPIEKIQQGITSLKLTAMRFELLNGRNAVSIINDAYNASPTSMIAAIEVVKNMQGFHEKILILGDIFELGEQSETLHLSIARVIKSPITVLYTYGNQAKIISDAVKKTDEQIVCKHFESQSHLLTDLQIHLKQDALLLFKASRGMRFESLIKKIM